MILQVPWIKSKKQYLAYFHDKTGPLHIKACSETTIVSFFSPFFYSSKCMIFKEYWNSLHQDIDHKHVRTKAIEFLEPITENTIANDKSKLQQIVENNKLKPKLKPQPNTVSHQLKPALNKDIDPSDINFVPQSRGYGLGEMTQDDNVGKQNMCFQNFKEIVEL